MAAPWRLLGPVRLVIDGSEVDLGPPKQRCVLAVLLMSAGHRVPLDSLVARVWGEPPPRVGNAAAPYVARLRRVLDLVDCAGLGTLAYAHGGYSITCAPDLVDLHRARRAADAARSAVRAGADEQGAALLRVALAGWHPEPLAGLPGRWAAQMREALRREHADLLADWAEIRLRLGDPDAITEPSAPVRNLHTRLLSVPSRVPPGDGRATAGWGGDRAAFATPAQRPGDIVESTAREGSGTEPPLDLGAVQIYRVPSATLDLRTDHRADRVQHDGPYRLFVSRNDGPVLCQLQREACPAAGDLVLYDTARPRTWMAGGSPGAPIAGLVLQVRRDLMPLPPAEIEGLLAVALSGRGCVARVLSAVLDQLGSGSEQLPPTDAARLSDVLVSLVVGVLGAGAGRAPVPALGGPARLRARINAYVENHLRDPTLTPARIAAEHHISVRYLHRLFQQQGLTVAGWIRRRRLEGCRRDLADPALGHRSVQVIAAQWGFTDESHFGRVFRSGFGTSPAAWRRALQARQGPSLCTDGRSVCAGALQRPVRTAAGF